MAKKKAPQRTYKYRLYPNKTEERALNAMMFHSKRFYNLVFDHRQGYYEATGQGLGWKRQNVIWTKAMRRLDPNWGQMSFDVLTNVIKRLDRAYDAFFRRLAEGAEKPGFPKEMEYCRTLVFKYGSCIKLNATDGQNWASLYVRNVGDVRVRYHRAIPENGKIGEASITKNKHGQWHVQFSVEETPAAHIRPRTGAIVGIDVGLKYALALSDGTTFDPPKFYEKQLRDLRILDRKLDRQRRDSNPDCYEKDKYGQPCGKAIEGKRPFVKSNRMKTTLALRKQLFKKVAAQRNHWLHEVTDYLTKTYDFIAIENLLPQFMIKNKRLALKALDISFYRFRLLLEYKAKARGVVVEAVPAAYSSQECHVCGHIDRENRPTQAKFLCVKCGQNENADIQAAKVILKRGLAQFNASTS